MPNYVLWFTGGGMPDATPAQQAAVMKEWMDWFAGLGKALVDQGKPFSGAAKTIAPDGTVTKGAPGTPGTGYTILKATSLTAAVKLAKSCPVLKGGAHVIVYETLDIM
jgi:hypothetical protein